MNKLNQKLTDKKELSNEDVEIIKQLHSLADFINNNPEMYDNPLLLVERIECSLQELWGFPLDRNYHRYSYKLNGALVLKKITC